MSSGKTKAKFCQAENCYNQPQHINLNRWDRFCLFHKQDTSPTGGKLSTAYGLITADELDKIEREVNY